MSQNVWVKSGRVYNLLNVDTPPITNVTGLQVFKDSPFSTFQGTIIGTGTVSCTITIQVSNDAVNWVATSLGTITLSGTTSASDGFTTEAPWRYVRAVVSAATGTITSIACLMSV